MKKLILIPMLLMAFFVLTSCCALSSPADDTEESLQTSEPPAEAISQPADRGFQSEDDSQVLMSYQEFLAADLDAPVTIEAYVQAYDVWQDGYCSLYAQDQEGAYYLDRLHCSLNDYENLKIGKKIRISGYKTQSRDSLKISDASIQLLEGSWIADTADVTALIGTDELISHQNEKVCFRGMTIEAMPDGHSVWYYGWDNTGDKEKAELYFCASHEGKLCNFSVKTSLCQDEQEVLQMLQKLQVGDIVDLTGFLRLYGGALPRITEIISSDSN